MQLHWPWKGPRVPGRLLSHCRKKVSWQKLKIKTYTARNHQEASASKALEAMLFSHQKQQQSKWLLPKKTSQLSNNSLTPFSNAAKTASPRVANSLSKIKRAQGRPKRVSASKTVWVYRAPQGDKLWNRWWEAQMKALNTMKSWWAIKWNRLWKRWLQRINLRIISRRLLKMRPLCEY